MSNWNLEALQQCPKIETIGSEDGIDSILYDNEPYRGQPTRAFAYLGVPEVNRHPAPGMVLVHGGGGTAFKNWVKMWNDRGYAAIAMDLGGKGPDGQRLPDAGPTHEVGDTFDTSRDWKDFWTYHAVACVIRCHSILRAQRGVDPERIGITGISWGGYLTCIVSGLDARFGCAVPVYGCGFLQDNSADDWMKIFAAMSPADRKRWHDLCDPSMYLPDSRTPMLFVTGTNDFAYPLDSYKKSYSLPKGPVTLCVRHEMDHGHEPGWAPDEIHMFADHHFCGAPALPRVGPMRREGREILAPFAAARLVARGRIVYTCDTGTWPLRKWHELPAIIGDQTVRAKPPKNTTVCFLAVEDEAGAYASSPHEEFDGK